MTAKTSNFLRVKFDLVGGRNNSCDLEKSFEVFHRKVRNSWRKIVGRHIVTTMCMRTDGFHFVAVGEVDIFH